MKVAGVAFIQEFCKMHPQSRRSLWKWVEVTKKAAWTNIIDVRQDFPHADGGVKNDYTVFNIMGNHHRLITYIKYKSQEASIICVLTHAEYDKWSNQ
jgi:mRNA interferase HigB